MTYSQKYSLVYFLTQLPSDNKFHMSEWPLHVTVVDVYAIDPLHDGISAQIRNLLQKCSSITTRAGNVATLGDTPVTLIEKTEPLEALHLSLVNLLEDDGALFNSPQFNKDGFLPHCTIQANNRLQKDNIITIDAVSLIDMFPNNDWQQRRVLETFNLRS